MKKKLFLYHVLPIGIYVCLILLFALSLSVSKRRPEILRISPEEIRSGDLMLLEGRNFGNLRNKSKIWLDDVFLPASAIEYWSDSTVKVRIPPLSGSGLVYAETTGGKSKGVLYILSERLPDRSAGAFLPGRPYLSTINVSRVCPGELVILNGDKLGNRRKNSVILVNRTGGKPESYLDKPDEKDYISVPDEWISNWTDNRIAFFLPDGTASGPVYIRTAAGYSNPVSIDVENVGQVTMGEPVSRILGQSIDINRVGALPGNTLVLWVPEPVFRPGQSLEKSERSQQPDRLDRSLQVFRFRELTSGFEYRIENRYTLTTRDIHYIVDPSLFSSGYSNLEALEPWLSDSRDVAVSYFNRTAAAVVKRERNPYKKALLIFDYVQWKLDPDREDAGYDYTQWMDGRKADAFGYASFFTALCRAVSIPARIVTGVWITPEDEEGIPHSWTEIFLPGMGWYPVDPSAPDGMLAPYLPDGADPPGGWGFLDNRYIAFSRGILAGKPFLENSRRIDFKSYSEQNIFEEWIGNLESCSISWNRLVTIDAPADFPREN